MVLVNHGYDEYETIPSFQLYFASEMSFLIGKHVAIKVTRPIEEQHFSLIFRNKAVVCFLNSAATK